MTLRQENESRHLVYDNAHGHGIGDCNNHDSIPRGCLGTLHQGPETTIKVSATPKKFCIWHDTETCHWVPTGVPCATHCMEIYQTKPFTLTFMRNGLNCAQCHLQLSPTASSNLLDIGFVFLFLYAEIIT